MAYLIETIKEDVKYLSERDFYLKYIVRSENWYFENVLDVPPEQLSSISDDFRMTVSEELKVSFNSIMVVGSSKTGFSFSPYKLFLPFSVDGKERKESDIDVAVISSSIFEKLWRIFRNSYSSKYNATYREVYCQIYRGYINEKSVQKVDACRIEWEKICGNSKKKLKDKLFIRNEVTYRIYRSWEDFEEYNLKNIKKIKDTL